MHPHTYVFVPIDDSQAHVLTYIAIVTRLPTDGLNGTPNQIP